MLSSLSRPRLGRFYSWPQFSIDSKRTFAFGLTFVKATLPPSDADHEQFQPGKSLICLFRITVEKLQQKSAI